VAIEDTLANWWNSFLTTLAETLAFDTEKMMTLIGLTIVGLIIARWGRGIIAKPLKLILSWKKIQEFTKIKPEDIDDKIGWSGLLYHVPNLFRVLIIIGLGSVALDLLELDEGSGLLGEVFLFIPNVIAVVVLLWIGLWGHYVGTDLIKDVTKLTFLKKNRKVPVWGFQVGLWGIIISISFTQLGVGIEIVPIIIWGVVGSVIVIVISLRDVIKFWYTTQSIVDDDLKEGATILFTMDAKGHEYKVLSIGVTHIKLEEQKHKIITYINHKDWTDRFYIKKPTS